MAQYKAPVEQLQFGGINTSGDVLKRPPESCSRCQDFRIMPGGALRLRGGRSLWIDGSSGTFETLHEFRKGSFGGGVYHLASHNGKWRKLDLVNQTISDLETINNLNPADPGAITTVRDKVFWTNGYGTTSGGDSKPALSSWDGTDVRYVGLDPFIPGTNSLAVNFTESPSGDTVIRYHRKFWVGLYNATTGHFSNAVYAGAVTNPSETRHLDLVGDLSISGLSSIARTNHGATELAEIYYVIYSTIDGGEVGYLTLDATGTDWEQTQSSSIDLVFDDSALTDANTLDLAHERPEENYPPRPMSRITYANGRVYGVLQPTISEGSVYDVSNADATAVTWSAAADDYQEREFVGVPEEAFPVVNKKNTPNGETPLQLAPAQGEFGHVLTVTKTGTFFLEETLPGVHVWRTVSWTDGIWDEGSFAATPYGYIWLTQKKELVLLPPNSDTLQRLSGPFDSVFRTGVGVNVAADYLHDPANYIDRYQIWTGTGSSVIYDFAIGGQAYTTTNQNVSVAKTMTDSFGQRYHVICIGSKLYAQEADPFTGAIPVADEEASGVYTEINGDWIGQWQSFGDSQLVKEFSKISVGGDAGYSAAAGGSPLTLTWYKDLASTPARTISLEKDNQSETDQAYAQNVEQGAAIWYKFRIQLVGRRTEGTYFVWQADGELDVPSYGTVRRVLLTIANNGNRP